MIPPDFVGHTFEVHNGKMFIRVFVTEEMVLSAEYLVRPTVGLRLPAGMSPIGATDYGVYAVCARPGLRDIHLIRAEDGEPDTSFDSIFHCIAILADAELGKRPRVQGE